VGGKGMESLKNISIGGLRELKENGLKGLKISGLKNLIAKPEESGTECLSDAELEDLAQKREEIKREIKKMNQEKEGIETRIRLIRKTEKEKCEEITEFPWREEIFPPLPRKTYVKIPENLEVKEDSGLLEIKQTGMKTKELNEKLEDATPEEKISEYVASAAFQTMTANNSEGADSKNETEKKDGEKSFSEKEEKTKAVYPFLAGKLNENMISNRDSGSNSIEKIKTESKTSTAASILGENLIEELLSSDDLNPEEEQGFVKYLQEPEIGELVNELKDIKSLLTREKIAA
jgi:cell division protein FtsB